MHELLSNNKLILVANTLYLVIRPLQDDTKKSDEKGVRKMLRAQKEKLTQSHIVMEAVEVKH